MKDKDMIVKVPTQLAREIYAESGDLPPTKFPALMVLASAMGKSLSIRREEKVKRLKPSIVSKSKNARSERKKIPEVSILTR